MPIPTISLLQVQAKWAYSEIDDGTLSHNYDNGPNVEELRAKHRSGVPFNKLTPDEQYNLAFLCVAHRPNLMIFMTGVDGLVEGRLDRTHIGALLVPEMVSGTPGFMSFEGFMNTTAESPKDARNVLPPAQGYQVCSDPLTVGHYFGRPTLLDGYHRAASFWKFAPGDAVIRAYLPSLFVSAA
jgi:hypothetical protein